MDENVLKLYPSPTRELPLKGVYLGEDLRAQSEKLGKAFVYSNFITSLDGRIAIPHRSGTGMTVPDQIIYGVGQIIFVLRIPVVDGP